MHCHNSAPSPTPSWVVADGRPVSLEDVVSNKGTRNRCEAPPSEDTEGDSDRMKAGAYAVVMALKCNSTVQN